MEKKSWDDIPSLDGLTIDWEYKPESSNNKRSFIRIKMEALAKLFEVSLLQNDEKSSNRKGQVARFLNLTH